MVEEDQEPEPEAENSVEETAPVSENIQQTPSDLQSRAGATKGATRTQAQAEARPPGTAVGGQQQQMEQPLAKRQHPSPAHAEIPPDLRHKVSSLSSRIERLENWVKNNRLT